jgi:hypothetical protein
LRLGDLLKPQSISETDRTIGRRISKGLVGYIEDLFWLTKGLANLGQNSNSLDQVTRFVVECQVPPFYGFARTTMGIATLENTFYALSILREVGVL